MIAQELLPSQAPYTILDYGVSAIALVVLGIVLWFVFKTQARIMRDHDNSLVDLVESMRVMKEELLTLVVETRHASSAATDARRAVELEQAMDLGRREEAMHRHRDERDHRIEAARHHLRTLHTKGGEIDVRAEVHEE